MLLMQDPIAPASYALAGQIYFQINRESSAVDWQSVQSSLSLALRLNQALIVGNIQGERVLTIKTGGQTATLQFTLYVVPATAP